MAGRRVYGGSDMAVLLQSEGIPPEAFEAMLASGSSHGGFHGSRSMVNFGDVCNNRLSQPIYRQPDMEEAGDEDLDDCLHQPGKKRRLTVDQVQFLEKTFEVENKLEPERKLQLAKDLGLQPRQVAIWFQNRRARWKTKQLEKDYEALKSTYKTLKDDYENLLKEKEKLKAEVVILTDKLHLKEEEKGTLEANQLDKSLPPFQEPTCNLMSEVKVETQVMGLKQEDLSSANSAVLDSESPHCTAEGGHTPLMEPADSSNAFEPDQSDLSHAEEDEEVREYQFLKLQNNSGSSWFPVEDQALWFWSY